MKNISPACSERNAVSRRQCTEKAAVRLTVNGWTENRRTETGDDGISDGTSDGEPTKTFLKFIKIIGIKTPNTGENELKNATPERQR